MGLGDSLHVRFLGSQDHLSSQRRLWMLGPWWEETDDAIDVDVTLMIVLQIS
jgi:hypothetical protein